MTDPLIPHSHFSRIFRIGIEQMILATLLHHKLYDPKKMSDVVLRLGVCVTSAYLMSSWLERIIDKASPSLITSISAGVLVIFCCRMMKLVKFRICLDTI
jgi:hypothetical protein